MINISLRIVFYLLKNKDGIFNIKLNNRMDNYNFNCLNYNKHDAK